MDRIRMLSLPSSSQRQAMARHLSRILALIEEIKAKNHDWFAKGAG